MARLRRSDWAPPLNQRLVMLCPYDLGVPGGVQNQAVALSKEMARRGTTVTLVTPGSTIDPDLKDEGVQHVAAGSVRSMAANGSNAPITLSYRRVSRAFRDLEISPRDMIHVHEPIAPVMSWPALALHPCAMVATFHRSGVDRSYRIAGKVLARRLSHIDVARSVSEAARMTALVATGIDSEILFNGVDLASIAQAESALTSGQTILFIGRDEPRKGRALLLEAARSLPETVTIWLTGDAPNGFQASGATVVFLGRLSEKEKHARLKAADVLCAPSLGGESFGIVLIEGLAARCTVVASDIDGYSQALSGHGLLVKPGSVAALSQGLRAALAGEGPDSEEGFSYAASWSIASLADAYEHAYDLARSKYSRRFNA